MVCDTGAGAGARAAVELALEAELRAALAEADHVAGAEDGLLDPAARDQRPRGRSAVHQHDLAVALEEDGVAGGRARDHDVGVLAGADRRRQPRQRDRPRARHSRQGDEPDAPSAGSGAEGDGEDEGRGDGEGSVSWTLLRADAPLHVDRARWTSSTCCEPTRTKSSTVASLKSLCANMPSVGPFE